MELTHINPGMDLHVILTSGQTLQQLSATMATMIQTDIHVSNLLYNESGKDKFSENLEIIHLVQLAPDCWPAAKKTPSTY